VRRVCVVGNSHLGAIKEGANILQSRGELKGCDLTFFGSPNKTMESCSVADGIINANSPVVLENWNWTSGGMNQIDLRDYDEVVFVLAKQALGTLPLFAKNAQTTNYEIASLSQQMIGTIIRSGFDDWYMKLVLATARQATAPTISHIGIPSKTEASPMAKRHLAPLQNASADTLAKLRRQRAIVAHEIGKISKAEGVRFYTQPPETMEAFQLFTKHEFSKGSHRLSQTKQAHGDDDYNHMNAAYGEIVLRQWLNGYVH